MCFSATAEIVAGVVVTGIGIDTIRHVGHDREAAMAGLPIVFGLHQLVEVPVWWGVESRVSEGVTLGAAWLYLVIAFGLIPWLVPYAVSRMETDPARRRAMRPLVLLGLVVAAALTVPVLIGPISVTDGGLHLAYSAPLVLGGPLAALYVIATCGSLLISSDRAAVIYGAVNLAVVAVLAVLLASAVISLWCVWAAVTSIAIAVHLRRWHLQEPRGPLRAAT